ncbi:MAG: protein kinase [Verrucomicrobiota bacterium]
MNPSNDRAETLFNSAAQLEPAVRASFLDHACAGNPVLRARVEELLGAAAAAGGFLPDQPQHRVRVEPQPTMPMEPGECLGEWVGRYKLLEKLGEGGCGVVYLAQQEEPVRRRVALKVIKLGMDTRQVVARFEAERQALALMDHPNIAKVLDGGTTDNGRPYFVMELVRGVRITDYCDEAQLNTPQRLELFLECTRRAARWKDALHRDLKPSNILVTIADGRAQGDRFRHRQGPSSPGIDGQKCLHGL